MTTVFHRFGDLWRPSTEGAMTILPRLPGRNFLVEEGFFGYELKEAEAFKLPLKMYGATLQQTERILNTFAERKNATGVLLEGEKGSGKTLLAKTLSVKAAEVGIPTLLVNDGEFCGDEFNKFIQSIDQPAIVFFDEFEKTYNKQEHQQKLLTLLDGVFQSKKLFVLTVNDRNKLDVNLINRPGRLFYMLSFDGLPETFVREYCEDRLQNKEHVESVVKVSTIFRAFNFDQLQALVEEMNRYGESPMDALTMLNVKPDADDADMTFEVELMVNDEFVETESYHGYDWRGNPLSSRSNMQFYFSYPEVKGKKPKKRDERRTSSKFTTSDFVSLDANKGIYVFKNQLGDQLRLMRKKPKAFAIASAL